MEESFQYWNSVLGRLVSFRFCLKLINSMQWGSDFFLIIYISFSLILSHFFFTIKCLRSRQKPRYIYGFQNRVRHTQTICFGLKNQRPMGHNGSPEWKAVKAYYSILDFQLPWQQINMRTFYNIFLLDGRLLNKLVLTSSVKTPEMRLQLMKFSFFPL